MDLGRQPRLRALELGMREVDAYPWSDEPADPSRWAPIQYVGPLSMYLKAGSENVREIRDTTVVRKTL